jgi:hypothetical protein
MSLPGLDEENVEFACGLCGRRLKKRARWLLRNPTFTCPNCYHDVQAPVHRLVKEADSHAVSPSPAGSNSFRQAERGRRVQGDEQVEGLDSPSGRRRGGPLEQSRSSRRLWGLRRRREAEEADVE